MLLVWLNLALHQCMVIEKKTLKCCWCIFIISPVISHWKLGENDVSPSHKNNSCQVWLKLAQWFWRRWWFVVIIVTDRWTSNHKSSPMSFQRRWAKNTNLTVNLVYMSVYKSSTCWVSMNWIDQCMDFSENLYNLIRTQWRCMCTWIFHIDLDNFSSP